MPLELITADQRLADNASKVSIVIAGRAKIGKTTLIEGFGSNAGLDPASTLFCNLEAGMNSIQKWTGPSIDIRSFEDARDLACLIGGADPGAYNGLPTTDNKAWQIPPAFYSEHHLRTVTAKYPRLDMRQYKTVFWDSITDLTRLAMVWAQVQPEAFAPRSGKVDTRGAYGLMGREMIRLLKHVQHSPGKNVIFIAGLDSYKDELNNETWEIQSEGSKTGAELPYIVDQVVIYSDFNYKDGVFQHNLRKGEYRAFCCKSPNPWGLPAGGRFSNLDLIEPPDLGKLMAKMMASGRATLEQIKTGA